MTHFSDGVRTGKAFPRFALPGAPSSALYVYDVVPAALAANNLSTAAAVGAAGNLVLVAGTGITAATVNGSTRYRLDIPRNIRLTSSGNDSGITFLISGYDRYGSAMSELVTGANAGVAAGAKAFYEITSIYASAAAAGTVSAGTGDVLGLPYAVPTANYVVGVNWAGTLARDAGTFVAAVNTAATTTTGDVRGTYVPSSATNASRRLTITLYLADVDTINGVAGTSSGLYGVAQA